MADIRPLNDKFAVAPQILPDELVALKAEGFGFLVNNRPDGEQPGQPTSDDMETAALNAGLGYLAIPVDHSGLQVEQVAALAAAMVSPLKILAFCRSGTRSAMLWSLAEASRGGEPAAIIEAAAAAGYDVRNLAPAMEQLRQG